MAFEGISCLIRRDPKISPLYSIEHIQLYNDPTCKTGLGVEEEDLDIDEFL